MSRLPQLPMTVIGGYLGAGKTTLINALLAHPHGRRLMVLVNDFGEINIDAALLQSADEDTLTLTNGCVCCTMGADLFMAIGDVLDRAPRPDHLIIEASGVADPAKIAQAAIAEPELDYAGIVTVVDALHFPALSRDQQIGAQLRGQVACADMVLVSKSAAIPPDLQMALQVINPAPPLLMQQVESAPGVLLEDMGSARSVAPQAPHPAYMRWGWSGQAPFSRETLAAALEQRPPGLFRVKGFVQGPDGKGWVVHCVGQSIQISPAPQPAETTLAGIGLASQTSPQHCADWWHQNTPD